MGNTGWMTAAVLVFLLTVAVPSGYCQEKATGDGKASCLKCHGGKSAAKKFADGDSVSTYVDPKAFDQSVHRSLRCTDCHREFSDQNHPDRSFRNKLQFRVRESRVCRDCHPDKALKARAVHEALLKKEKAGEAVLCTNCHDAHAIAPVAAGPSSTAETAACLGCHAKEKEMQFANGEALSIRVNPGEIMNSPHKSLGCSDCHFGFSPQEHPRKRFRSAREYRISSAEMCRRCHYDKYSKVSEGIHHAMLSVGRLDTPNCVDCHGGHTVVSLGKNRLGVVKKCQSCHGKVYEAYAQSVHGRALFNEDNRDVPICIDCHSSHNIADPAQAEFHNYIPDTCSTCHSNAALMGKYGLTTDVVKTYLSDFHGVTLSLYRKQPDKRYRQPNQAIAVCTDCHGTHDIARASGADTQALKSRLLKRCQSCHAGATENFPDAWLSHYRPSLTVAPLVFVSEKFYALLLPLVILGLLFQIGLDLWRYLVKR